MAGQRKKRGVITVMSMSLNQPKKNAWNKLTPNEWAKLLTEYPQFRKYCDKWNDFTSWDWETLLTYRPEFEDVCNWEKLNQAPDNYNEWGWIYSVILFQPKLAHHCTRYCDFDDFSWFELLRKSPVFFNYAPQAVLQNFSSERYIQPELFGY